MPGVHKRFLLHLENICRTRDFGKHYLLFYKLYSCRSSGLLHDLDYSAAFLVLQWNTTPEIMKTL